MTHNRKMAEELVTQEKVDLLNQMAGSNISLEVGIAFISEMLEAGNIATLLQERAEFERVVRSNFDNLTRLDAQAESTTVATAEEIAAIQSAKQILADAFNYEGAKR